MVRGLLYSGHRIPILVFVAQSENTSMIISLGRGQEVSSTPWGHGEATWFISALAWLWSL